MFKYLTNHKNGNLVLIYHSSFQSKNKNRDAFIHNVTPKNILEQINFLSYFYDIVSIDNIFESKSNNQMAITFDDGYANLFDAILPELHVKKIPSTVFLIGSSFFGNIFWREKTTYLLQHKTLFDRFKSQYFTKFKSQINYETFYRDSKSFKFNSKKLDFYLNDFFSNENIKLDSNLLSDPKKLINSEYVNYGNHTFNHYVLSTLSYEEQYEEIKKTKDFMNSLDLNLSNVFAFPFGGYTDFNDNTLSILSDLNIDNVLLNNNIINDHALNKLNHFNVNYLDRFTTSNNKYLFIIRILKNLLNI